jgi:hypothetical protein
MRNVFTRFNQRWSHTARSQRTPVAWNTTPAEACLLLPLLSLQACTTASNKSQLDATATNLQRDVWPWDHDTTVSKTLPPNFPDYVKTVMHDKRSVVMLVIFTSQRKCYIMLHLLWCMVITNFQGLVTTLLLRQWPLCSETHKWAFGSATRHYCWIWGSPSPLSSACRLFLARLFAPKDGGSTFRTFRRKVGKLRTITRRYIPDDSTLQHYQLETYVTSNFTVLHLRRKTGYGRHTPELQYMNV